MARRKARTKKERLAILKRVSPGARPGTLVSDPDGSRTSKIRVFSYGPVRLEVRELLEPKDVKGLVGKLPVTWIDVDGVGDAHVVAELGKLLDLHPLALEDTMNLYQRPKSEEYPTNLFVVVRMAAFGEGVHTEQLAIFLGDGFVVTFQGDKPGDCLDPVRKRLQVEHGRHRSSGADYLAYSLIDTVIDHYFPSLDAFGEGLEQLEDELIAGTVPGAPERIQRTKQELLVLRRTLLPLRDVLGSLSRDENRFIRPETRLFFRDCFDHTVQLMDTVNTYRELAGGLMELHLSAVSNRMNEIMKVLTLISAIFIPLTFIVGVYGMNFDTAVSPWNMPELEWRWGYPAVMLLMAVIAVGLMVNFKRRGWFEPTR